MYKRQGEYYAFNASAADGYVLVSGDDRMPAVIGYSDEGKFDADAIPDNMREWLETYAEQVRYVQTHAGVHIQSSTDQTSIGNVYPLLGNTKWNQSAPYNNMCPTFSNNGTTQRAVTGCVATAMAQVMYYHRWPETGTGSNTYTFKMCIRDRQSALCLFCIQFVTEANLYSAFSSPPHPLLPLTIYLKVIAKVGGLTLAITFVFDGGRMPCFEWFSSGRG